MSTLIKRGICLPCFSARHQYLAKVTAMRQSARLSSTSEEYVSETETDGTDIIEQKRNVSHMSARNRRKMSHASEMPEIKFPHQHEPWYRRRLYAKYGSSSGIDPSDMWPTRTELNMMKAHEQEFQAPLLDRINLVQTKKAEDEAARKIRIETVERNMEKMDQWIGEFNQRQKKKDIEKEKQNLKKQQLLEEAREYFGYEVDPRDAKFQKMIEEKELEAKKLSKMKKKQMKVDKILLRVQAMADSARSSSDSSSTSDTVTTSTTAVSSDSSKNTEKDVQNR